MVNGKFQDIIFEPDVYALTDKGNSELRGAETSLSSAELELLVCIDGSSTVAEIRANMRSLAESAFNEAFRKFVLDGLIEILGKAKADGLDFTGFLIRTRIFSRPERH